MTLSEVVRKNHAAYPLLGAALQNATKAHNPKVEWLVERFIDGETELWVHFNYCQIFRADIPEKVAAKIEEALGRDVPPTLDSAQYLRTMAGVPFYNGTEPLEFHLKILSDLRQQVGGPGNGKWIAEISVIVPRAQVALPGKDGYASMVTA